MTGSFVQAAVLIAVPLLLWGSARRLGLGRRGWALIGYGALFFVIGLIFSLAVGFIGHQAGATAGPSQWVWSALAGAIGQEGARFLAMRSVAEIRERLDRPSAIVFGLGQGGFQVLGTGLLYLANALFVRNDPAGLAAAAAIPWQVFLIGTAILLLRLALHVGLSLVMARAVLRGSPAPLLLALVWHAVASEVEIALQVTLANDLLTLGWVALVSLGALAYGLAASTLAGSPPAAGGAATGSDAGVSAAPVGRS